MFWEQSFTLADKETFANVFLEPLNANEDVLTVSSSAEKPVDATQSQSSRPSNNPFDNVNISVNEVCDNF